jgi:hypothetical protein
MTALTLIVAVLGGAVIWTRRPAEGLVAYVFVLCLYPQYLAVSTGSIDWSVTRLLALIFVVRLATRRMDPQVLRFRWMDALVLVAFVGAGLPHLVNDGVMATLERESGRFFDMVMTYGIARVSLQKREDAYTFMGGMVWVGVPLAAIGVYQMLTGQNPYAWMRAFAPTDIGPQEIDIRHGLYRADASFGNKISFGLYFTMAWAMLVALVLAKPKNPMLFFVRSGFLLAGAVSALSSAPMFALVSSIGFMMSFPMRRMWPYVALIVVAVCGSIEAYSDRHFYHVLTRLAFDSSTAFYRIELIEEALGGGMDGHWLLGYGYVTFEPGAPDLGFHWRHNDLANIYVGVLARSGLMGLVPLLALNGYYYWCLYLAGRAARGLRDKWTIWCIAAGLFGWNVAMMTVGALEQTNQILYMMIALAGASRYVFAPQAQAEAPAPVAPQRLVRPRAVRT